VTGTHVRDVESRFAAFVRGHVAAGLFLVLFAVAAATATIATWTGAVWAFEIAVGVGIVVGLVVAFGGLDRGKRRRHRARREDLAAGAAPWLTRATAAQLDRLDPVEHRRLDLGAPWPAVVVGTTGVSVVAVAGGDPRVATARLADVVEAVTAVTAELRPSRRVDVRGLLVVAPGRTTLAPPAVQVITPAELGPAVAHGSLVSMATVTALFARLSGVLAPDLQLDAS
jgi:hypothetical protein